MSVTRVSMRDRGLEDPNGSKWRAIKVGRRRHEGGNREVDVGREFDQGKFRKEIEID
jgi:hypothetical protein